METSCTSERLLLTTLTPASGLQLLHFYNKNRSHFEPWEPDRVPGFYSLQFQKLTLGMEQQLMAKNRSFRLWIFLKEDPTTIIGSVNFYNIVFEPYNQSQIGYKLDKSYLGKGYAHEAVAAAMKLFFTNFPQIHRIEASIMPSNMPSLKLIHKLGYVYEGTAKSSIRINRKWEDHHKYVFLNMHSDQ